MTNEERLAFKYNVFLSQHMVDKLRYFSSIKHLPISRLIAYAVDVELEKERPFEFDFDVPRGDDDYMEYAYADEAGKILRFMKKLRVGMGLDMLLILRHDMGISDRETFRQAFRECLEKDLIESFKPKRRFDGKPFPDGYFYYRLKGTEAKEKMKIRRKRTQYDQYMRLKRKFAKEEDEL